MSQLTLVLFYRPCASNLSIRAALPFNKSSAQTAANVQRRSREGSALFSADTLHARSRRADRPAAGLLTVGVRMNDSGLPAHLFCSEREGLDGARSRSVIPAPRAASTGISSVSVLSTLATIVQWTPAKVYPSRDGSSARPPLHDLYCVRHWSFSEVSLLLHPS